MDAFDPVSLRLFVAICEEQSLTEAAFRENLTVSAVSKRLLLLEQQVGAPLVGRGRGGVQLTSAGEALLPAARGLLQSMARIRANLSGYAHKSRDHVRVACTPTAVTAFAPQDIADFVARHPEVNVKLDEHMANEVVHRVKEGHADLGIIWDKTSSAELETVPYRRDHMVLVVNKTHALAQRERVRFSEVLPYDCVTVYAASVAQHLMQRAAIAEGRALRSSVCVRTYEGACHVVAARLGIALVPDGSTSSLVDALGLVAIPLDEEWAHRRFVVCMRDRDGLILSARQLLESLAALGRPDVSSSA